MQLILSCVLDKRITQYKMLVDIGSSWLTEAIIIASLS